MNTNEAHHRLSLLYFGRRTTAVHLGGQQPSLGQVGFPNSVARVFGSHITAQLALEAGLVAAPERAQEEIAPQVDQQQASSSLASAKKRSTNDSTPRTAPSTPPWR